MVSSMKIGYVWHALRHRGEHRTEVTIVRDGVKVFHRSDCTKWSYEHRDDGSYVLVAEFPPLP